LWRNKKRLMAVIRDYHVDIVHARSRAPAWSGYWAAKANAVPFMTTFHAAYKFHGKLKKRYNEVMSKGVRVIAISHYIAQHILDNYHTDAGISASFTAVSRRKNSIPTWSIPSA
jgi:hypothetical protein